MDIAEADGLAPNATRSEELVYLLFGFWNLIGLCLDGWAHRYQPELESFFTPWHAVFYSGFSAAAGWLAFMTIRRRRQVGSLRHAIPNGYGLAVVGLGLFALGGVGDAVWHTFFGIETAIDALLSPTHLVLLVGMLAGITAPIRSAWRGASDTTDAGYVSFLPVTLSVALATTGIAFFHLYANGFNNWPQTFEYIPAESDVLAGFGIFAIMAFTVILLFPVLFLTRRWRPPLGTFTTIFGVVGVFMAGLDAYANLWQMIAPLVGGLTADFVLNRTSLDLRPRIWVTGAAVPATMWLTSTLATHLAWEVEWPPDLWLGVIVMASLAGFALAILAHPPAQPMPPATDLAGDRMASSRPEERPADAVV